MFVGFLIGMVFGCALGIIIAAVLGANGRD